MSLHAMVTESEYASPEETLSLMVDLVTWYNQAEKERKTRSCGVGCIVPFPISTYQPF